MFTLIDTLVVDWPVQVNVPADGGRYIVQRFTAKFEILGDGELREIFAERGDVDDHADKRLLRRALVGWGGVRLEGAGELEFSDEARERLLAVTYVRVALVRAYYEAAAGGRRKN